MAKNYEVQYSTTSTNNTDIDGQSTLGSAPADTINEIMQKMAKLRALGITRHVVKVAGTYAPALADQNQFWRCTGAVLLNLTAAATLLDGWALWVRANGGTVTIDPNGAELIDGAATLVLSDGQTALIICTGTAFFTVMQGAVGSPSPLRADGRLTLTTGVPVTTGDVSAAPTIFYAPFTGNVISLYNGTSWVHRVFTQISIAATAALALPYDLFIFDNAGTAALEILAWSSDTARATPLARQDGVLCKSGALTRRYVGTFYATGVNLTEDSAANRYLWNMYNRVRRYSHVFEATATWTYTVNTLRQARASTANQLNMVRGLDEDSVSASLKVDASNSAGAAAVVIQNAIGLDSTTTADANSVTARSGTVGANATVNMIASYEGLPGLGKHSLVWLEQSTATGTTTWAGGGISGIHGSVMA